MYHYPKDSNQNYSSYPDSDLLILLKSQLSQFDNTIYLSIVMRALCDNIILYSRIPYDSTKILPGLDQLYTQVYKILQAELFQWKKAEGVVKELQYSISTLNTINKMARRFQLNTRESTKGEDLLGELEVDISNSNSENKAQNNAGRAEFSDDSEFFEP